MSDDDIRAKADAEAADRVRAWLATSPRGTLSQPVARALLRSIDAATARAEEAERQRDEAYSVCLHGAERTTAIMKENCDAAVAAITAERDAALAIVEPLAARAVGDAITVYTPTWIPGVKLVGLRKEAP